MPKDLKQSVEHWITQTEFQIGFIRKDFEAGDYNRVRKGFKLMASMMFHSAGPDSMRLYEEEGGGDGQES